MRKGRVVARALLKILLWSVLATMSVVAQDRQSPELIVQIGHVEGITLLAFSPGGQLLVSGSDDGTVKLWDFKTGKELRSFPMEPGRVPSVDVAA